MYISALYIYNRIIYCFLQQGLCGGDAVRGAVL